MSIVELSLRKRQLPEDRQRCPGIDIAAYRIVSYPQTNQSPKVTAKLVLGLLIQTT